LSFPIEALLEEMALTGDRLKGGGSTDLVESKLLSTKTLRRREFGVLEVHLKIRLRTTARRLKEATSKLLPNGFNFV